MYEVTHIDAEIERILATPPYGLDPTHRRSVLLALLKAEIRYACDRSPRYRNYVEHWPVDFHRATTIPDLPYLPASAFKCTPALSLVDPSEIRRTIASSATTGQVPSRVVLDAATARRMTKSIIAIIRDFIGPVRRPYWVVDVPENLSAQGEMGARGAAIQSLRSFATDIVPCLKAGDNGIPRLDTQTLLASADKWREMDVLVYGFTHVIWSALVEPLRRQGLALTMPKVHVLHSGGWKKLEAQSVTKDLFVREVARVFGCAANRVIDYYGMVENVGVIYPDCDQGNKHVPGFAEVIVRDPLTLAPAPVGQRGFIQVCSVLPTSFPGFLVLSDDIGEIVGSGDCPCGRRGTYFRFVNRMPKAEIRGCSNVETSRHPVEIGAA